MKVHESQLGALVSIEYQVKKVTMSESQRPFLFYVSFDTGVVIFFDKRFCCRVLPGQVVNNTQSRQK